MNEGDDQKQQSGQPGWVFNSDQTSAEMANAGQNNIGEDEVSWSASEYISNPKNSGWFLMLGFAVIVISTAIYLITHDIVSVVVIVLIGVAVGVFAAREPRTLKYKVGGSGVQLGLKFYPYQEFKSFSVIADDAFSHISLSPLKRFMPPLSLHYSPEDEDKILKMLADYLPYEEPKRDFIENFTRKIRF